MSRLVAALDVAPLHGHRTGVGTAVAHLVAALEQRDDVAVAGYLASFRARPEPPTRRLPLPAAVTSRTWAWSDRPRVDRWLGDADLVHGTNYVAPPSRLPTVVSVYDCWFLAHPELASPVVRRAGAVLRRAVRRGATVHVTSHATATAARDLLATDRVEVIHLGPPDAPPGEPVRPAGVPDGPFVLALGTVERRKDLPRLVAAFAAADVADLRLVLAGRDGDDAERVREALTALAPGVRRRVVATGAVTAGEKAWLLRHATVLAYPSLDEGFGFPVLEAQQHGLPVVATDVGSIPEVGGDGVHLVPAGSTDALADALARAVADDDLRARLVRAGLANVARFSWSATAASMVELYRRTVEEAR